MGRSANSFARPTPRFKLQPRVLVLCEDSKSSLTYLKDAARYFRSYADIEIAHCGKTDPIGIVTRAVERRRNFDTIYCAIDRDTHSSFDQAVALAAEEGIEIIASFPCYEFWLLLHFQKTRAPVIAGGTQSAGDKMTKILRAHIGMESYAKGTGESVFHQLLQRLPLARERAAEVIAEATADGNMNPSTRLHELISHFQKLGLVQEVN